MMRNLDLNNPPHSEDVNTNLELGLPSSQVMANQNDDVTIISRRNFELAVGRPRRNRMTMQIQYAEAGPQRAHTAGWDTNADRLRTVPTIHTNDDHELVKDEHVPQPSLPMPQQRVPAYSCPICMEDVVEETATKCGHVFCKRCIMAALADVKKCPICRRRLKTRDWFRIYLSTKS